MTEENEKHTKDKHKKKHDAIVEQLEKEKQELFEKLQRISADYANYQKRAPKQLADSLAYEKDKMVKAILPVMDNFEHTLKIAKSAESVEAVAAGIQIIYDQMVAALKSIGVEQIIAAGEKFDPSEHQAMLQQYDPQKEDGVVLEQFHVGYKLNGRVIRPSKVVVNKVPQQQQQEPAQENNESETSEDTAEE